MPPSLLTPPLPPTPRAHPRTHVRPPPRPAQTHPQAHYNRWAPKPSENGPRRPCEGPGGSGWGVGKQLSHLCSELHQGTEALRSAQRCVPRPRSRCPRGRPCKGSLARAKRGREERGRRPGSLAGGGISLQRGLRALATSVASSGAACRAGAQAGQPPGSPSSPVPRAEPSYPWGLGRPELGGPRGRHLDLDLAAGSGAVRSLTPSVAS